jgi:hypothetical protein
MITPKLFVFVGGVKYPVREVSGLFKADLNGYYGWSVVYADSIQGLERRIKQVRSGGQ